jgi:hypothetical protein
VLYVISTCKQTQKLLIESYEYLSADDHLLGMRMVGHYGEGIGADMVFPRKTRIKGYVKQAVSN